MKTEIPYRILSDLKYYAPSFSKEGDSRGYGYDEYEETYRSYKSVLVLVQKGLANYSDVFSAVADTIIKIQEEPGRKYPIIVASFGDKEHLEHEGKYFEMGYMYDRYQDTEIAKCMSQLSTEEEVCPATIPELFPKTDLRSLYDGKSTLPDEDILIIVGKKNEVFFHSNLKEKIIRRSKERCTLLVEIDANDVNWVFKKFEPQIL
ncbi:hypothetical protein L21SP5_03857 [Salinivirga cyanobacteriivorans]|uniref:Uncharacterized protein n=1 Tax=Salinivirga cyanobacteriivorans TaxID=1307839 RepID=A0A0S2I597_9BACT|nr:hypothetical protein [Salinivirga cyanobacteriivorans]ALO17450.1 hypothetical protein L21SP5_03857 [Salinivirga cyanobacteriivorans]